MPIHLALPIDVFDQERFHDVDRRVTGIAFEIHNEFGRFLEERLYQRELTLRCRAVGLDVEPEFRIRVCLEDFSKEYFADHMIDRGVIVETKAVAGLDSRHRGQALNYLFLAGLHHGILLNFRPIRVEHEFVSTGMMLEDRKRYEICTDEWRPQSDACANLETWLRRLLKEWGAFLDPGLYRDGLTHFLGGKDCVIQRVKVRSGAAVIGGQRMRLLNEGIAFSVTTATHFPESILEHQKRLLVHTNLSAIHWINLNHQRIELRTIMAER